MKYLKKQIEFEDALNKEWIITNGIGGYSSSTIIRNEYKKISWPTSCATYATGKKIFGII